MLAGMQVSLHHRIGRALGAAGAALRTTPEARIGPTLLGSPLVDYWSAGSIGPRTAAWLSKTLLDRRPRRILECGPGLSTVVMARTLALTGSSARIVSLEHSERWASIMRRRLRAAGVRRRVDLFVGSLVRHADAGRWYGRAREALALGPFDFVFLDGPPATDGAPRRAPALPLLWEALAPGALVVLDDANRRGERACIDAWRERYAGDLTFERLAIEKGLGVFEKRALRDPPRVAVRTPALRLAGVERPASV